LLKTRLGGPFSKWTYVIGLAGVAFLLGLAIKFLFDGDQRTLAFCAVSVAIIQLILMLQQTNLMDRQDFLANRRARLSAFAQVGARALGSQRGLAIHIAVINEGERGAASFHIYVNAKGASGGLILNDVWDESRPELFHRTVYTPVFANDAIWLRELVVAQTALQRASLSYRIAYDDGYSGWGTLRLYGEMPSFYRAVLEADHDGSSVAGGEF